MNLLQLLKIIPVLFEIIKSIEAALPEGGKGKEKLQLVRAFVENIFGDISEIWPNLEKIIATIVTFLNTTGVFKKS